MIGVNYIFIIPDCQLHNFFCLWFECCFNSKCKCLNLSRMQKKTLSRCLKHAIWELHNSWPFTNPGGSSVITPIKLKHVFQGHQLLKWIHWSQVFRYLLLLNLAYTISSGCQHKEIQAVVKLYLAKSVLLPWTAVSWHSVPCFVFVDLISFVFVGPFKLFGYILAVLQIQASLTKQAS